MTLDDAIKNAMLQGMVDKLSEGVTTLAFFDADKMVAEFVMPKPLYSSIAGGKIIFNTPDAAMMTSSSMPIYARLQNDGGAGIALDVGTDITLDSDGFYAGGTLTITGISIQI